MPLTICMVTVPHIMVGLGRMLDYTYRCRISEVSLYPFITVSQYIAVGTSLYLGWIRRVTVLCI